MVGDESWDTAGADDDGGEEDAALEAGMFGGEVASVATALAAPSERAVSRREEVGVSPAAASVASPPRAFLARGVSRSSWESPGDRVPPSPPTPTRPAPGGGAAVAAGPRPSPPLAPVPEDDVLLVSAAASGDPAAVAAAAAATAGHNLWRVLDEYMDAAADPRMVGSVACMTGGLPPAPDDAVAARVAAARVGPPPPPTRRPRYHLQAVVRHEGKLAFRGHYTADVRGAFTTDAGSSGSGSGSSGSGEGKWHRYDDSYVRRLEPSDVLGPDGQRQAYMLMYVLEEP